jgi:hypothetical protein
MDADFAQYLKESAAKIATLEAKVGCRARTIAQGTLLVGRNSLLSFTWKSARLYQGKRVVGRK